MLGYLPNNWVSFLIIHITPGTFRVSEQLDGSRNSTYFFSPARLSGGWWSCSDFTGSFPRPGGWGHPGLWWDSPHVSPFLSVCIVSAWCREAQCLFFGQIFSLGHQQHALTNQGMQGGLWWCCPPWCCHVLPLVMGPRPHRVRTLLFLLSHQGGPELLQLSSMPRASLASFS